MGVVLVLRTFTPGISNHFAIWRGKEELGEAFPQSAAGAGDVNYGVQINC